MSGQGRPGDEQAEADELAAVAAYWSGRLDGFCAELESKGFQVERDGLTVRITVPERTQ